ELASLRGRRRRPGEIIEYLTLHPLHLGSVSARHQGQFLGAAALAQARQQVEKVGDPLLRDRQLVVVLNHGRISTIPRRLPSRFHSQLARNCSSGSPSNMSGRIQKTLAPNSPSASAWSNRTRLSAGHSSIAKSLRITRMRSTSFGSATSET